MNVHSAIMKTSNHKIIFQYVLGPFFQDYNFMIILYYQTMVDDSAKGSIYKYRVLMQSQFFWHQFSLSAMSGSSATIIVNSRCDCVELFVCQTA